MNSSAEKLESYTRLLVVEHDAWANLRSSVVDGEYDPRLLAAWLEAGRRCESARQQAIDTVLDADPGVAHRPLNA
jgi:hypothetical protein